MNTAFIGLGSNLNNPKKQVQHAIESIRNNKDICLLKSSSLYTSKPYGYVDQDDFVNAVIKIETQLNCKQLFNILQDLEVQQKRIKAIKWGPRIIDLDILAFNHDVINNPDLIIPHKEIQNRIFVLKPWAEIEPNWVLPNGQVIIELYNNLALTFADQILQLSLNDYSLIN